MKLRVRSAGRTLKVDFDEDPTVVAVKERVAVAFGHDAAVFELSLNGRDALEGDPDTPLSHFDIVSGDLLRIIRTHEGAVQSPSTEHQAPSSSPSVETGKASSQNVGCTSMEVGDGLEQKERTTFSANKTNIVETPTSQDDVLRPSASEMSDVHGEDDDQAAMDEGETQPRSVQEPMLCRSATDCMIPQRLRALYIENKPETLVESLCIVLHVLMLEAGFHSELPRQPSPCSSQDAVTDASPGTPSKKQLKVPSIDDEDRSESRASMPSSWRVNGVHKLSYYHPSCEGAVCSVACVPVGKLMAVHGVTSGKSRFHLQLKPSDYVTSLDADHPSYTNLPQLSRLYKDSIAYPLLLTTRSELGLVPLNGLLALFPEIQLLILSFLDVRSLLNVSEVCQQFQNMASDRLLWRQLLLRDFGCKKSDRNEDWRKLYKEKYKTKKDRERYRRSLIERSLPVRPGAFYPPTMPGYPPGYRGGDYDLDPFAGLAQPPHLPIRRDPRIMPGQPSIVPFPDLSPHRDPLLNPLPRVPNRRDPLGNRRTGNNNQGFFF